MDGILGVWLITFRSGWPVVLVGAALLTLAVLPRFPAWTDRVPPSRAVLWILLSPLALVIWSGANWGAEEHSAPGVIQWRSYVLLALALGVVIIAVATPIRFRRAPRWWLLIPCSITAVLFATLAVFVGGMAIVNDWL